MPIRVGATISLVWVVSGRHYHQTGAMHWVDVDVVTIDEVETRTESFRATTGGSLGLFVAALSSTDVSAREAEAVLRKVSKSSSTCITAGLAPSGMRGPGTALARAPDGLTVAAVRRHHAAAGLEPADTRRACIYTGPGDRWLTSTRSEPDPGVGEARYRCTRRILRVGDAGSGRVAALEERYDEGAP